MAATLHTKCIALAISAIVTISLSDANADEFVSRQYGFRFTIPEGFHEQDDNGPHVIKSFTKGAKAIDDIPIAISLQNSGQEFNPSERVKVTDLPYKDGWNFTLEMRHWQDIDLQVVRGDAVLSPNMPLVTYHIIFPLKEDAIHLLVQGPKSREQEVSRIFDESIHSFINLKTYTVRVEVAEQGKPRRTAILFTLVVLLPVVILTAIIFWLIRILKTQRGLAESREPNSLPLLAINERSKTGSSMPKKRLTGVALLAILNFLIGSYFLCLLTLAFTDIYLNATGPVSFSWDYEHQLFSQFILALTAISSAVGLFWGAKWGWWLGGTYWAWCLGRQVLLPIAFTMLATRQAESMSGEEKWKIAEAAVVYCLFLAYMLKKKVLDYFRLDSLHKVWALSGLAIAGLVLSICFRI